MSYTSWYFIYDFPKFNENTCGVFIFANAAHHVKYIGYAEKNVLIDEIANSIVDGKDQYSNLVMAVYTSSIEEARKLSRFLIEKYKPVNNLGNKKALSANSSFPRHI